MKNTPAVLLSLLTFALPIASLQADHHEEGTKALDLAGSWKAQAESDNGTRTFTFSFERNGDTWSGKSVSADGDERALEQVKVEGNSVTIERQIEANGEKGTIRLKAEGSENGARLKGKWAVLDSSNQERMGGDFSAEKEFQLDLVGEWDSTAMIGDDERAFKTTFNKDGSRWLGGFAFEDNEVKFNKITTEGKNLTCEFSMAIEVEDRNFRITAEAKSENALEGKWVALTDSGEQDSSGKWSSKRQAKFALAGTWMANAQVNGESLNSTLTIMAASDVYTGKISNDAGSLELSAIKLEDEKLTLHFTYGEAKLTINATAKDNKLAGKWSVTGDDGTEHSDTWNAVKQ